MDNRIENLANLISSFKKGSKIHIKKENRGKFTDYCGGKVTSECIARGKSSPNPAIRKRATFAANARKWKHAEGGILQYQYGGVNKTNEENPNLLVYKPFTPQQSDFSFSNFPVEPVKTYTFASSPIQTNTSTEETAVATTPEIDTAYYPSENQSVEKNPSNTDTISNNVDTMDDINDIDLKVLSTDGTNEEKRRAATKYLMKNLNLTKTQASALIGNWDGESKFVLNAENKHEKAGKSKYVKASQYGIGIGQWTHGRHDNYVNYINSHGKSTSLQNQLDFAIDEIKTKYQDYLNNLRTADNIKDATAYTYVQYVGGGNRNIKDKADLYRRVDQMVEKYKKTHLEQYGKASNGFEIRLKAAEKNLSV